MQTGSSEVIYDDVPCEDVSRGEGDLIYEDVQKEEVPQGPNNGWSSSEFESYDEQSDSEKASSRSKRSTRHRDHFAQTEFPVKPIADQRLHLAFTQTPLNLALVH
ncbi:rho guanine nucleotide exchange factor 10-like protein isoform X1 [Silurus asotus]|uniref:Rho guanine nucleotide exchange factor 10-like protein isoform X1 n=1 Tax=Silurus asotus TaxID=30991 RepID=A0AAD5A881_SILAS|nr:rho guanine nucleotide exchange factor 10-like protein isoform X1 [Silurus asotus]